MIPLELQRLFAAMQLSDVHAVGTLLRQEDASASREALLKALAEEESVRVRVVLLDGFIEHDWELGKAVSEVQKKLPTGYVLDGTKVRKK